MKVSIYYALGNQIKLQSHDIPYSQRRVLLKILRKATSYTEAQHISLSPENTQHCKYTAFSRCGSYTEPGLSTVFPSAFGQQTFSQWLHFRFESPRIFQLPDRAHSLYAFNYLHSLRHLTQTAPASSECLYCSLLKSSACLIITERLNPEQEAQQLKAWILAPVRPALKLAQLLPSIVALQMIYYPSLCFTFFIKQNIENVGTYDVSMML